jgi:DNA-binding TFAR19-related protein (PDSD5 family)
MEVQMQTQETQAKMMESRLDAVNRQRDRESRERLAAVRLAEKMAQSPEGIPIMQQMIDPGMLERLENNEKPIPGSE